MDVHTNTKTRGSPFQITGQRGNWIKGTKQHDTKCLVLMSKPLFFQGLCLLNKPLTGWVGAKALVTYFHPEERKPLAASQALSDNHTGCLD